MFLFVLLVLISVTISSSTVMLWTLLWLLERAWNFCSDRASSFYDHRSTNLKYNTNLIPSVVFGPLKHFHLLLNRRFHGVPLISILTSSGITLQLSRPESHTISKNYELSIFNIKFHVYPTGFDFQSLRLKSFICSTLKIGTSDLKYCSRGINVCPN